MSEPVLFQVCGSPLPQPIETERRRAIAQLLHEVCRFGVEIPALQILLFEFHYASEVRYGRTNLGIRDFGSSRGIQVGHEGACPALPLRCTLGL
jgi:hypothetical protein